MFLPGLSCSSCDTRAGHCLHSMCLQTRTTQGHLLGEPGSFPRWALLHPAATLLYGFGVRAQDAQLEGEWPAKPPCPSRLCTPGLEGTSRDHLGQPLLPQNKLQNLRFSNTASLPRIAQRKGGVLWEAVPNRGALHSSRVQLCTPRFRGAPRT